MYTLHIGNKNYSSWSVRPWVLLTELGIPFHERLHIFGPLNEADEAYFNEIVRNRNEARVALNMLLDFQQEVGHRTPVVSYLY